MQFVSINDKPPIRLLRQRGAITDSTFAEFLAAERSFKLRQALRGQRWVDVYDIRRFEGLSESQRTAALAFLQANLACLAEATLAVAFVVPPQLRAGAKDAAELLRTRLPVCVEQDIDEALHWALDVALEADAQLDPALVIEGIDAFRSVLI